MTSPKAPKTRESLRGMLEKNLAKSYDASRDTVRKARSAILMTSIQIATNSDKHSELQALILPQFKTALYDEPFVSLPRLMPRSRFGGPS